MFYCAVDTQKISVVYMLSCGFGLEPEGNQPGEDVGEVWGNFCLSACRVEAAELLQVEGTCADYTLYTHAC